MAETVLGGAESDRVLVRDMLAPKVEDGKKIEGEQQGDKGGEGEGEHEQRGNGADAAEARARRLGWRPEAEFKGKGDWLPADKFIEKVETEAPVRNERLRFLESELTKRERLDAERDALIKEQGGVLKEMLKATRSAEQRAYDRARAELIAERDRAVAAADPASFQELDAKLQELDKTKPALVETREPEKREPEKREAAPEPVAPSAAMQAWVAENSWFDSKSGDPEAAEDAISLFATNMRKGMSESANLAAVRKKIEALHPHLFENPRRKELSAVNPPSGERNGTGRKKDKTAANLPDDAKAELARFKRLIPGFTDKEYLADYKWDN